MRALLEQLCQANAPTGFEGPAVEVAKHLLTPLVDEVYTDRIGSVVGVKRCGKENARRVLLDAHLDEGLSSWDTTRAFCASRPWAASTLGFCPTGS